MKQEEERKVREEQRKALIFANEQWSSLGIFEWIGLEEYFQNHLEDVESENEREDGDEKEEEERKIREEEERR